MQASATSEPTPHNKRGALEHRCTELCQDLKDLRDLFLLYRQGCSEDELHHFWDELMRITRTALRLEGRAAYYDRLEKRVELLEVETAACRAEVAAYKATACQSEAKAKARELALGY